MQSVDLVTNIRHGTSHGVKLVLTILHTQGMNDSHYTLHNGWTMISNFNSQLMRMIWVSVDVHTQRMDSAQCKPSCDATTLNFEVHGSKFGTTTHTKNINKPQKLGQQWTLCTQMHTAKLMNFNTLELAL